MSLVFSIKQTGVPAGGMLAGALVPGLLLLAGWQGALLAVAAACLACVGLAQPLRAALDAGRQPYPVSQDGHPNAIGYRAIAESIAGRLAR